MTVGTGDGRARLHCEHVRLVKFYSDSGILGLTEITWVLQMLSRHCLTIDASASALHSLPLTTQILSDIRGTIRGI